MGEARPDLRSVDDQFVALDPPARLDAGKVRPRAGFRKALAPDRLAFQDTRQVIGFLRLARIKDQRRAAMVDADERSEEHTSELQSLMRISYAVFCLKKKNSKHN